MSGLGTIIEAVNDEAVKDVDGNCDSEDGKYEFLYTSLECLKFFY